MEKDQEEFSDIDGNRAFLGLNSEGAEIEKLDPMLKRIQPTNAAGIVENTNVLQKNRQRSESLAACQNLYLETTKSIEAILERWKDKKANLLPDDVSRLKIDSMQLNSDHQEMDRLTSNLIKLFNDKGSLQEAKMTTEATEALNINVNGFKDWCRANLGPASNNPLSQVSDPQ